MVRNKREFRVVSLQRMGHHAVVSWIISMCPGFTCYLNNMFPGRNPFQVDKERYMHFGKGVKTSSLDKIRLFFINNDAKRFHGTKLLKELSRVFLKDKKRLFDFLWSFLKKDYLIYSYEDRRLRDVCSDEFGSLHDRYLGRSSERVDILVLRDPFNFFASRMKWEERGGRCCYHLISDAVSRLQLIELWKEYAREFLGETNFLKNKKLAVNYNEWFSSVQYRQSIAQELGLEYSDQALDAVHGVGLGSSFSGFDMSGSARKLKVSERWRHFVKNRTYREIFYDKELLGLSRSIFGRMSKVEEILGV